MSLFVVPGYGSVVIVCSFLFHIRLETFLTLSGILKLHFCEWSK